MGTFSASASEPRALGSAARASWGVVGAAVGVAVWLIVDPRTPDLAAQVYRANLFREAGFVVWDSRWYAGHDMPGYSLLFPPLGAWLGVRTVGAAAVLASAALFEAIARRAYGAPAGWGAVWFAVTALGDVWSGRVTFALGVSIALGAVLALQRGRTLTAALLAGLCAACSPVAGALLALVALVHALAGRPGTDSGGHSPRSHPRVGQPPRPFGRLPSSLVVLGLPAALVVAALSGLFGEGGWEPFPLLSFLATVAAILGFLAALAVLRSTARLLWVGAAVYLLVCVACVAVHTPMGANVERLGVLLAGPLLLYALLSRERAVTSSRDGDPRDDPRRSWRLRAGAGDAVVVAALLGIAVWTAWGPVRETAAVAGNISTGADYYLPVERFIAGVEYRTGQPVRVEVPFTRGHWEAAWLAPRVFLARGWEKQLDERYDGALLSHRLTAAAYRRWLNAEAVRYVALPDAPLDHSSAQEGRLIEAGLPYLREVRRTRHWQIYEVLGATPLAQGPGTLTGIGHDWFSLRARTAGHFLVRVRYTRYFTVLAGAACVARAPGGWTEVSPSRAGAVHVAARFSIGRALGLAGNSCRA